MIRARLLPTLLLVVSVSPVCAEDWTEFRGPGGQGHAKASNLPTDWSTTKNVVWKQAIPGKGWSSPVVVKDRVYLTVAVETGNEYSLQVRCLDAKTGKPVWDKEVKKHPGTRIHTKNSHASPTPIVAGERIYVHFGTNGTFCLDLTGKIVWSQTTLTYAPVHGSGGSPILVDDVLISSCDGSDKNFVVGLEAATGKVKWKTDRGVKAFKTFCFSTPLCIEVDGKKQVVSPGPGMVAAYEPATGKEIWRFQYPVPGYSVIPRPVYGHGLVFLSTGYDAPVLLAIKPTGTGDVTKTHLAWSTKSGAPHTPSPLLVGDELYMVSDKGVASCLDAKTGTVHWTERIGGAFSASPVFADDKIYLQSEEGVVTALKPGKKYENLGTSNMEEKTLASLGVVDRAIYLRTEGSLYRIEKAK